MSAGRRRDKRIGRRAFVTGTAAAAVGTATVVTEMLSHWPADETEVELVSSASDNALPLDYVNVRASPFHAVGDGQADDTAAIANAYASAESNRRPLYFPAGVYKVTSLPSIASYMTVLGGGEDLSTILYQGTGTLLTLSNAQRVAFKKIGFWLTGASGTIVSLDQCFRCSFDSVVFRGQHVDTSAYLNQTGVILTGNTGGTTFINCDFTNLGIGLQTSCIQNYITNSKFNSNNVSILGTSNNFNAGLAIQNTDFVSTARVTDKHIYIDGKANNWWLTNVWFEGARSAIVVGEASVGGPSQFGMVNCQVAATKFGLDLQYCRQPYLANVIFYPDSGGSSPTFLRINPQTVPQGSAINLINTAEYDFPLSTFPSGWNVIGRAITVNANGPIVLSPNGHAWQLKVSNTGALTAADLGVI
ncbi:mannuronan epimerase [Skermania sp. ID1734]|uniref:glycosyl hydrolase family 28-related protein n=1 Tax=Skermania sp. ID1734 TaxID=2597516 RepID=UPI0011803D56|nr:glycosyl hydrolase family 28-related protein [Skermania sp. ID1734]TSE00399.1 mannuronan epimerase [Skermania sp. ID1734]